MSVKTIFRQILCWMDNSYRKVVAKNVREFRQKLGLTQEGLAEKADLHWTYISGVERCKYNISLGNIVTIARALNRSPHELLK
jgi:predicted transcriptional regulator